jgi:hypothetical protein
MEVVEVGDTALPGVEPGDGPVAQDAVADEALDRGSLPRREDLFGVRRVRHPGESRRRDGSPALTKAGERRLAAGVSRQAASIDETWRTLRFGRSTTGLDGVRYFRSATSM